MFTTISWLLFLLFPPLQNLPHPFPSEGAKQLIDNQMIWSAKGLTHGEELIGDTPRRIIVIDLKDIIIPPLENKSGRPLAFPREGAKRLLDNNRLTFGTTPGQPTNPRRGIFTTKTWLWFS